MKFDIKQIAQILKDRGYKSQDDFQDALCEVLLNKYSLEDTVYDALLDIEQENRTGEESFYGK